MFKVYDIALAFSTVTLKNKINLLCWPLYYRVGRYFLNLTTRGALQKLCSENFTTVSPATLLSKGLHRSCFPVNAAKSWQNLWNPALCHWRPFGVFIDSLDMKPSVQE